MQPTRRQALRTMAGTAAAATAVAATPAAAWASTDSGGRIIERDVVVVGGGSSGTYTAVRLRDLGKSVAVVERKDRLGGATETYHDPATGLTTDIGVMLFHDLPIVRDYFGRFGVPLVGFAGQGGGGTTVYADFRTGRTVPGYTPPVPTALGTYLGILEKYPYLEAGYDLPDPVPAELLQPWGDFVAANGLASIAPLVYLYGQGFNGLMQMPTVYILKYFGLDVVSSILSGSFLTTAGHDNSRLYEQATAFLGDDVHLQSTVIAAGRDAHGVVLLVDTPEGPLVIKAGKAVITVPPLPGTLAPFGLDATEYSLFSRFQHGNYYTGLLSLPGVPGDLTVNNIGADTQYNLPPLPEITAISPSNVPGLFDVKFGAQQPLSDAAAQRAIIEAIGRLQAAGTIPATKPSFAVFSNHSPYELTVSAADIAGGFYRRLYALQGRRSTFWNGAAFQAHDSTLLWEYTETLLPSIAA